MWAVHGVALKAADPSAYRGAWPRVAPPPGGEHLRPKPPQAVGCSAVLAKANCVSTPPVGIVSVRHSCSITLSHQEDRAVPSELWRRLRLSWPLS